MWPIRRKELRRRAACALAGIPILGEALVEASLIRKYGRRVVTRAKVRNFIQVQRDIQARAIEVESLPWCLNLDTFNGCNLKCPFCPTGTSQLEREKARMSVARAKQVIDQCKEHVLEIRLYNWGEPFLNPDIFEIIRHARDAGLFTVINSNLSVNVPDLARKIVDSGLDRLQASVDGIDQKVLEIYRRKSNADTVFRNVRAIADERHSRGARNPDLALAFLVFRHNEHELPLLEAKRREIGADRFTPRRAFIFHESFVPRHPDFQPLHAVFFGTCDYLYSELTVEASGAVSPCCANMSTKWDTGDVSDLGDLRQFWNRPTYRAMRAFTGGKGKIADHLPGQSVLCQHCALVHTPTATPGPLSPLPPSFQASGTTYAHGLDDLEIRHFGDHPA